MGLSLIEVVKKAQNPILAGADGPGPFCLHPTWLDPGDVASGAEASNGDLVTWRGAPALPPLLKQREEQEELLSAELKARSDTSLSLAFLDDLLRSHLEQVCNPNPNPNFHPDQKATGAGNPKHSDGNVEPGTVFSPGKRTVPHDSFAKLLEKASPRLGQKLLSLTLRACLISKNFDEVKAVLCSRAVSGNTYLDLVPMLMELDQPALICMWVQNVCDPRFSDLLSVIKYFLSSCLRAGKSLAAVRFQWRNSASEAIQRLSYLMKAADNNREGRRGDDGNEIKDKKVQAKENDVKEEMILRSIALSTAVDHFQPYELCLHYIVSAGHDENVLTSVLLQLENKEALKLLSYLKKWIQQYSRHAALCGFDHKRMDLWVPSLRDILQWTSVLLDAHMTALVLCPDFSTEIQAVQSLIRGLVDDSRKLATLLGVTEHLRSKGSLPTHPSLDGNDEHVIEYLDI